jgi:hypothetical protein
MNITNEELEGFSVKQFLNYQMTLGKITFTELMYLQREIPYDKSYNQLSQQEKDLIKLYIQK